MAKSKWIGTTYFDENGIVQPDRWIYNGRWWYRYGDGSYPKNKFDVINNNVYYFNSDGYMLTRWQVIDGNWYYFDSSGIMAKNRWIGNYYLLGDGTMAKNQWIGRYYVGSDGCWR